MSFVLKMDTPFFSPLQDHEQANDGKALQYELFATLFMAIMVIP
jgi:hypothetical protein